MDESKNKYINYSTKLNENITVLLDTDNEDIILNESSLSMVERLHEDDPEFEEEKKVELNELEFQEEVYTVYEKMKEYIYLYNPDLNINNISKFLTFIYSTKK